MYVDRKLGCVDKVKFAENLDPVDKLNLDELLEISVELDVVEKLDFSE